MSSTKVAITLDTKLLARLDSLVAEQHYPSRSRAIQDAVQEKLDRLNHDRLARESAKLNPVFERAMADDMEYGIDRKSSLYEIETINDRHYNEIRESLEQTYAGKWVVIANGKLAGIANSLEEANQHAADATDRIVYRIGEQRPQEVELGWQMAFD
jgi:Arc/MetJ-type ribon-helix-helix transcriptional regulator